ncbi:DNA recombination protein RecN, partial [Microbacterium sp. SUBG005]
MIEEMRLKDLGVIADATLPIGRGFTAITGETGAGKTMVVTGLGLLLGQRADSGAVRSGAAQAAVEGVWLVPEDGPVAARVREAGGDVEPVGEGAAELYLGRTVSSEGRGRATVGGRTAPAGVLADLADDLVVVHGQSDQLRLRSASAQREALDRFGGEPVATARATYRAAWDTWRALDAELTSLTGDRDERAREAEQLRAAIAEIEAAAPLTGEEDELARRAERLANAEELRIAAVTAHAALSNEDGGPDVVSLLAEARRALERISGSDAALAAIGEQVADLGYRATDASVALSGYLADLDESGPHELAAVDERRGVLAALARTHGSVDAAIELLATGSARLVELDDDGDRLERLTAQRDDAARDLDAAADALTAARREAAERLGAAVT